MKWWLCLFVLAVVAARESILPFDDDDLIDLYQPVQRLKDSSKGLQEFTPIRNTIVQSQTQYYSFSVNTSAGIGSYYEFLIFLSGNICDQPDNVLANETSLAVYWSFNLLMFSNMELGQMMLFESGYFQALADVPTTEENDENTVLYIAVRAPENTDSTASWLYQIGVSQNDLVFQWDDRSWASLVDTDDTLALIVTGNLTSNGLNYTSLNATESTYALFIYSYDYKDYFNSLNSSWCAIRNGPSLLTTSNFETTYTTRNGGLQQQFHVPGLNSSTKYIAYLVSDFKGTNFGGLVYQPFEFQTQDSDACQLIFDLLFCERVAYAVPANLEMTKEELGDAYDAQAEAMYLNFSKALAQIPCDTTKDAAFSPICTCDDCASAYKDWLCSVTIPRCTTFNHTGHKYRPVGESRNDFINNEIVPQEAYFEVLPCVNVCQAIVRNCPSDFGFQCPTTNESISLSYYWDEGSDYASCNYVGSSVSLTSGAMRVALNWVFLVGCLMIAMN